MKRHLLYLAILTVFAAGAKGANVADCALVPGWQQAGPVRHYSPDNLFEYMDGNAEGYLLYGFVQLMGVTCKSGENTLVIDVSEMTDPDAAYGIFTSNRDPNRPDVKIGMAGQIMPRRGVFVKGSYYVEIAASPENDHTPALRAFMSAMETKIDGQNALPEAIAWFPTENLTSLRLIPESVLGIRPLKRGYVAEYKEGKAFLVLETSPASASAVMNKLRQRYPEARPEALADEALTIQDKYLGGVCFFRKGRFIAGYANLPDPETAAKLATAFAARLP
jgi:Family of unknown function (DUF6599)